MSQTMQSYLEKLGNVPKKDSPYIEMTKNLLQEKRYSGPGISIAHEMFKDSRANISGDSGNVSYSHSNKEDIQHVFSAAPFT